MHRYEPPLVAIAVCLAALAGFVDALAFTSFGGFFASFMSGNSTRLGVGLGSGSLGDAAMAGALILSFVAGVVVSSVVARAFPVERKAAVMALVTALLVLAALAADWLPGGYVLLLLAAAMGAENGVFNRDGEVTIALTYLTGSLVRMGQRLAAALMGEAEALSWLPYLMLWAGFVAGVVMGAGAHFRWGWSALWIAALAAAVLTVAVALVTRRPSAEVSVPPTR